MPSPNDSQWRYPTIAPHQYIPDPVTYPPNVSPPHRGGLLGGNVDYSQSVLSLSKQVAALNDLLAELNEQLDQQSKELRAIKRQLKKLTKPTESTEGVISRLFNESKPQAPAIPTVSSRSRVIGTEKRQKA